MKQPIEHYKDVKFWKPSKVAEVREELNNLYSTKDKKPELNFENKHFYEDTYGTKNRFVAGKIYNFDYFYSNEPKERIYVDTRPNVLVYNEYYDEKTKLHKFSGIDLNYLPDIGVVVLLNFFFSKIQKYFRK